MNKKYFLIVLLVALIAVTILSGNVYPLGHNNEQSGIGGSAKECNICHDFLNGIYGGGGVYGDPAPPPPPPSYNIRWVKRAIKFCSTSTRIPCNDALDCPTGETCGPLNRELIFENFSNFADGNAPHNGACEVCHTQTKYYKFDGSGESHYTGNCTICHPHFLDDINNYFEPRFVGNQAHFTHFDDPKGPMLGTSSCTYNLGGCHNPSAYIKFGPENAPLSTTTVCNSCHSQGGAFNGVGSLGTCSITPTIFCNEDSDCPTGQTCNIDANSVAYGAKANWEDGIYEPPLNPGDWPNRLRAGKEDWCAACHDDQPANSKRDGTGINAPKVMGDNVTYGYKINGHGLEGAQCYDCHNLILPHIDGDWRTYAVDESVPYPHLVINSYKEGYRLIEGLAVPRYTQQNPEAYRLCMRCHNYSDIVATTSNFRDDDAGRQFHLMHLESWPQYEYADTDFDGIIDSAITCITCHNVHGANGNKVMIRHGELISTPGTTNKVPALDFRWYKLDKVTRTTVLEESRWGGLLCGVQGNPSYNDVCEGCHGTGELTWYRTPGGPLRIIVEDVWTTNVSNVRKNTFLPGEQIHYHLSFTVEGPALYFVRSNWTAQNTSGTFWQQTYVRRRSDTPAATYHWIWESSIPANATRGSGANVSVIVRMYDTQGGTLITKDSRSWNFNIAP